MTWNPDPGPSAPVIWLSATYTVAEAAALCGVTLDVIHGAVKGGRLMAGRACNGNNQVIAGLDLWKFWRAERRRMRLAAEAAEGGA